MVHYLHYHKWSLVLERIRRSGVGPDPFDKIGSDNRMPGDIVGSTVWGITRNEGEWFFTGRIDVKWSGRLEDMPESVSRPKLSPLSHYAACPEDEAMNHGLYEVGIGSLFIPRLGKTLEELDTIQLSGFLESLDGVLEFEDWVDVGPEFI